MSLGDGAYVRTVELKRAEVESFDIYPFCIPAIRNLSRLDLHPNVTFFVGDNGTGKSTLLEAIAVNAGFNAEGGSRNFRFATRESHSQLYEALRMAKGIERPKDGYFLRAESFFNVASEIDRLDTDPEGGGPRLVDSYGGRSLHEQSHGESFLSLLTRRFGGNGLYLLDEPEAALSPSKQLSVLSVIHQLVQRDSQFVIVTHSPILMAYPHATIYLFSQEEIRAVRYEDTEHYTVTLDFLTRYESMLRILLGE